MNEVLDVISQVVQLEDEARRYYLQAAAKAQNPLAKNTFQWLAQEELQHRQYFMAYYQAMERQQEWPPMSEVGVTRRDTRGQAAAIFEQALAQVRDEVPADIELTALYNKAMEFERQSIELYRARAQQTNSANARQFYEFLADQEQAHLDLLAATLEYLDRPNLWHLAEERWIVEG